MAKYPFKTIIVGEGEDELHPDVVLREKNRLIGWYLDKLKKGTISWKLDTKEKILDSVESNITKAVKGYERAPRREDAERTLIARLSILTKYHNDHKIWSTEERERLFTSASQKQARSTKQALENFIADVNVPSRQFQNKDDVGSKSNIDLETSMVYTSLIDEVERAQYIARRMQYEEEFEFNNSSDRVLLEAVLADEILLLRITKMRMAGKPVADELTDDINKRLRENLKLLGVSRTQRIADDTSNKGSVAEISVQVEEKLQNINQLRDEKLRTKLINAALADYSNVSSEDVIQLIEEIEMLRQRSMRPDMQRISPISTINEIPDYADIDKLLQGSEHDG